MADSVGVPAIRPAATLVALRSAPRLEVLMVRRSARSVFMGSAWVFPGGAVDSADEERAAELGLGDDGAYRVAAVREFVEEAGVAFEEPNSLVPMARWITPPGPPRRFDAMFFAAEVSGESQPTPDLAEVDAAEWVRPDRALQLGALGDWLLTPPTVAQLERLVAHDTAAEALEAIRHEPVVAVAPRVAIADDGSRRIVFPGDPGYEAALA